MAITLRFQSTGSIPGNGDPVQMHGASLTIGRGNENDLVLPDPNRELSKRHCAIEDHNGNVIVVDFSTNGTFLNYGKLALGSTPTPLNDGDILSVGPYEILVNISSDQAGDMIADPLADTPVSHGQAEAAPTNADLLDAPGDGGDFLDDLLGGREAAPAGPGSVQRDEPGDDGLLPPLGEDEGILPPAPDPFEGQGASAGMHNPSMQDHFSASRPAAQGHAIPDDWDEDFLSPVSSASAGTANPFGAGGPQSNFAGGAIIPDEPVTQPQTPRPTPTAAQTQTATSRRAPAAAGGGG
ncbi:MAG: type VI secretion system-associated FHA domain protein, partial [Tateyamaria sp.]